MLRIIPSKISEIRSLVELSVHTNNHEQLAELKRLFVEAGIKQTSSNEATLRRFFRFSNHLQYFWTSDYEGGSRYKRPTFDQFVFEYCEVSEPAKAPELPKLHDKQVLLLAEMIQQQEALIADLKANGNAIKALKAEMGVA